MSKVIKSIQFFGAVLTPGDGGGGVMFLKLTPTNGYTAHVSYAEGHVVLTKNVPHGHVTRVEVPLTNVRYIEYMPEEVAAAVKK